MTLKWTQNRVIDSKSQDLKTAEGLIMPVTTNSKHEQIPERPALS